MHLLPSLWRFVEFGTVFVEFGTVFVEIDGFRNLQLI